MLLYKEDRMAKSKWISICHNYFQNKANTQQITCEYSSSEEESGSSVTPPWKKRKDLSPIIKFSSSRTSSTSTGSHSSINSSLINNVDYLNINEMSPEVSQRTNLLYKQTPSPIIEKKRRTRRKKRKEMKKLFNEFCDESTSASPECLDFHLTQNIENESPVFDSANASQRSVRIEPFPSQFGSIVEPEKLDFSDDLYYQPPKRKKHFKKGGLAYQLHTFLKCKKSRTKIWNHERRKGLISMDKPEEVIKLKYNYSWTEYGNTLLECDLIHRESCDKNEDRVCLVNLGVNQILTIEFIASNIYKLYPPYRIDNAVHKGKTVPYYYNVSKVIASLK